MQPFVLLNWIYFRFLCDCIPVPVNWKLAVISPYFALFIIRTLYIVWSLVRRRVTRRLTRLQTMYNVLIINIPKYGDKRRNFNLPEPECNRTGTGNKFNLIMRMTVPSKAVVYVSNMFCLRIFRFYYIFFIDFNASLSILYCIIMRLSKSLLNVRHPQEICIIFLC